MKKKNLFSAGGQNLPPVVNLLQEARERIYHNKRGKTYTKSRRKEPRKRINHNKEASDKLAAKSRFSSKVFEIKIWSFDWLKHTCILLLTLLSRTYRSKVSPLHGFTLFLSDFGVKMTSTESLLHRERWSLIPGFISRWWEFNCSSMVLKPMKNIKTAQKILHLVTSLIPSEWTAWVPARVSSSVYSFWSNIT